MFDFITDMTLTDMVAIGIFWLLSLIVGTVIVWKYIVPYFLPDIIVNMLISPKPRTLQAIQNLAILVISAPIKTGKKVKNENGKEIDEEVPMLIYAGREIVGTILHKMNSAKGGLKGGINAQMEQAIAESGGDANALLPIAFSAALRGDYGLLLALIYKEFKNNKAVNTPTMGGTSENYLR